MSEADIIPNVSIGRLRDRVEIQTKILLRNKHGGFSDELWSTDNTVWAGINPVTAKEGFESQRVDAKITHKIFMRYTGQLTKASQRIVEVKADKPDRVFHIDGIRNIDERDRSLEVSCKEVVA